MADETLPHPTILPLGDRALLVRFAGELDDAANRAAVGFARLLAERVPRGVTEFAPNLVSVLLRYDPREITFDALAGEVRLLLGAPRNREAASVRHRVPVDFGDSTAPDLAEVASVLGMTPRAFVEQHCAAPLRVLATGFAPGFVYCGFHADALAVPRRATVRASVPPGTILFAARQTAITSTTIPTGWHVIGRTSFSNFDPASNPPTRLRAGDEVTFEAQW